MKTIFVNVTFVTELNLINSALLMLYLKFATTTIVINKTVGNFKINFENEYFKKSVEELSWELQNHIFTDFNPISEILSFEIPVQPSGP